MFVRRTGTLVGLVLLGLSGCGEPGEIVPITPPGATIPESGSGQRPGEAQGEMASVPTSKSKTVHLADYPPALPTAEGETKTTEGGVKYETLKEGTGPHSSWVKRRSFTMWAPWKTARD